MRDDELIAEIAIPSPLFRTFDYTIAVNQKNLLPGVRVQVSFGRRELVGILLAVKTHTHVDRTKLKPLIAVLDQEPVIDTKMLQLLHWAASYYHHPVGEVIFTALPTLLRKARSAKPVVPKIWSLTDQGKQVSADDIQRAPRQALVLKRLQDSPHGLTRDNLPVAATVLSALQKKGWIQYRQPPRTTAQTIETISAPTLSEDQQKAIDAVQRQADGFQANLLDGVTGSGKTEVYLRLIEPLLKAGKQTLVLVPEIGLTPQLIDRFRKRFATTIAVLHSGLNDNQRLQAWQQAASGHAKLILGTRSAIFTPLKTPGIIIVDEEHDTSLKQQDGFRYSARDIAVWRARQLDIPIILGTATPSLESLFNAKQQRYQHLSLPKRAGNAIAPRIGLLDLCNQPMRGLLSKPLLGIIKKHLDDDSQVLLFLNRRGFAPVLMCHACGWVGECERCDARLTLHRRSNELRCHHCGSARRVNSACPECASEELLAIGEGTERIEQALLEQFPQHPVLRIDRDTTRRKGQLEQALERAQKGHARILLGTQMLSKGHHFPGVTLVAILEADQGIFSTDFRASERMAQQIIQVAGRAGRAEKPGEVIIQTHHPDHPLLQQLVTSGYDAFADVALQERQQGAFPPFTSIALLRAEAPDAQHPNEFLENARRLAETQSNQHVQLWGPVAAPMERRAGRYRAQLMIQTSQRADLQKLLHSWIPQLEKIKGSRQVRWSIDVDPVDLF